MRWLDEEISQKTSATPLSEKDHKMEGPTPIKLSLTGNVSWTPNTFNLEFHLPKNVEQLSSALSLKYPFMPESMATGQVQMQAGSQPPCNPPLVVLLAQTNTKLPLQTAELPMGGGVKQQTFHQAPSTGLSQNPM